MVADVRLINNVLRQSSRPTKHQQHYICAICQKIVAPPTHLALSSPLHTAGRFFYRGFHMHHIGQRMVTLQYGPTSSGGAALMSTDSVELWNFWNWCIAPHWQAAKLALRALGEQLAPAEDLKHLRHVEQVLLVCERRRMDQAIIHIHQQAHRPRGTPHGLPVRPWCTLVRGPAQPSAPHA